VVRVRIRIDLAYDGGGFRGWARQPGLRTVQATVEAALATVLRVPEVRVVVAGRTDTGVHARGQVLHVDLDDGVLEASAGRAGGSPYGALVRRLNGVLPPDVRAHAAAPAPEGFDARFSATWRRYAYRVCDGPADPLTRGFVVAWPQRVEVGLLNEAAARLLGLRDFASFCRQREGATTIRTLQEFSWAREADVVTATVRADAFCHSMVRSLVGCLLPVGDGRRPVGWVEEVARAARRDPAVAVAPPHGLTLEEVGYPDGAGLVAQADRARALRTLPEEEA
jgi:tRNA pseudouridine38-40 synthase